MAVHALDTGGAPPKPTRAPKPATDNPVPQNASIAAPSATFQKLQARRQSASPWRVAGPVAIVLALAAGGLFYAQTSRTTSGPTTAPNAPPPLAHEATPPSTPAPMARPREGHSGRAGCRRHARAHSDRATR